MVRRRFGVGYDPGLPQLRPIARPFDFSLSFPNYQNARPNVIDISEIAGIAAGVRHVDQRNQYENQQEQDAQDKQNQDRATEQAAEFIAKNAELAKGDQKTLDEAYAAGKLPEWADPRFQKGFFALRGAAVGRDAIGQFENDAAEFGPRAATMPQAQADAEWEKIRGKAVRAIESDPSYQNEYGKRAALAVFEQHEPQIRAHAIQAMGAETRKVAYQDMGNNFRRLAKDFANQVDGDPDTFIADWQAAQQLAHQKFGMRSSKELALASTGDELLSMENKERARSLLAQVGQAQINGVKVKDDEIGGEWARDVGIKLDNEAYAQERQRHDLFTLRQSEALRGADKVLYRQMYDAFKAGEGDSQLLERVDAYVKTLPGEDQEDFGPAILEAARKDWDSFRTERRSELIGQHTQDQEQFDAILGQIKNGVPSEDAIRLSGLPPGMQADLRDLDASYQEGDAVVRKSNFEKQRALITKPITDAFRGDHRETQSARYAALVQAQPLIDQFTADVYEEAQPFTDPKTGATSIMAPADLNKFIIDKRDKVTNDINAIVSTEQKHALERMSLELPGDDKKWRDQIADKLIDARFTELGYAGMPASNEKKQTLAAGEGRQVTESEVNAAYNNFITEYRKDAKSQIEPGLEPEVFQARMKEAELRAFGKVTGAMAGAKAGAQPTPAPAGGSTEPTQGVTGATGEVQKAAWRNDLDRAKIIYSGKGSNLNVDNYDKYVDQKKSELPSRYADAIKPVGRSPIHHDFRGLRELVARGSHGLAAAESADGDSTQNAIHSINFDKGLTETQSQYYAGTMLSMSGLLRPENIETGEFKSSFAGAELEQLRSKLFSATSLVSPNEEAWLRERMEPKTIKLDMIFDPYLTDFGFKDESELRSWAANGRLAKFIANPRIQLPASEMENFIAYQMRAIARREINK